MTWSREGPPPTLYFESGRGGSKPVSRQARHFSGVEPLLALFIIRVDYERRVGVQSVTLYRPLQLLANSSSRCCITVSGYRNYMPSAVAEPYPAPVKLAPPTGQQITVTSILEDHHWRRYFGALAQHYSQLLADTTRDARLVDEMGEVVYLIDADVIRNLAESRYEDNRLRRESVKLFQNSSFKYALPLGAFQEIVEWLRGFIPGLISWKDFTIDRNLNPEETILELARAFDITSEDLTFDRLIDRISEALGTRGPVLERLTTLFSPPNFLGVVADYQLSEVAALHRILGLVERSSDNLASRAKRDFRDAINLALVCQSSRRRTAPSYVLVTQTRAVLYLLQNVKDTDDQSFRSLSDLLGFEGAPALENLYPVLSPRRAFMVEEIRSRYGFGEVAGNKLRDERRTFEDLEAVLRDGNSRGNVLAKQAALSRLQNHLEYLVNVYYQEDSFYRDLEADRIIEASLKYLEDKHRVEWEPGHRKAARLKADVDSFLKIARRLEVMTTQMTSTSYQLVRSTDESGALENVEIFSRAPEELVMDGEIYLSSDSRGSSAYSLSWHTDCSGEQFFSAVGSVVKFKKSGRAGSSDLPLEYSEPFTIPPEGIVIYTNRGIFVVRFEKLPTGRSLRQITLADLHRAILQYASETIGEDLLLEAVRVSTPFGDFQLNLTGNDPKGIR